MMDQNENVGIESQLKQFGQKSISPVLDMFSRHTEDVNQYISALTKAFEGAKNSLGADSPEAGNAEKMVSLWIGDATSWLSQFSENVKSGDKQQIFTYLQDHARSNPGLSFVSSYVAGMVLGRLGKYYAVSKISSSVGEMDSGNFSTSAASEDNSSSFPDSGSYENQELKH